MKTDKVFYGEKLRYIREKLSITQQELSETTGIKQSVLARFENDYFPPKESNVEKLANALYCKPEYFRTKLDYKTININLLKKPRFVELNGELFKLNYHYGVLEETK